jgi:hypothetical protein
MSRSYTLHSQAPPRRVAGLVDFTATGNLTVTIYLAVQYPNSLRDTRGLQSESCDTTGI